MTRNRYLLITVFMLILILSACATVERTVSSNEIEGIQLEITINKQEFSSEGEIIVKVIVTNHNDSQREVYIPSPMDTEESIAAVMVERESQRYYQFLDPYTNQDIPNIKERTFYDFVLVQLGANETIEQEFRWNKELVNQENREIIKATSGEYILSSFIILDELNIQEDYYEPETQLISKLNFTIK